MQIIEPNREQLNNFVEASDGSFQQSWQWGELQERMNRPVKRFLILENDAPLLAASFVRHDLRFGKYYWLCPRGPVIATPTSSPPIPTGVGTGGEREGVMGLLLRPPRRTDRNDKNCVFIRIEPEQPNSQLTTYNFLKAPKDHNPRATILVDLTKSEDELLEAMHPKTRYNLRLAMKKELGIMNYELGGGGLEEFWRLLVKTAKRDKFHLHPKKYYEELLKLPGIGLFLAYFSEKLVAGAMVSFFADKAVYLHGSSDYEHRSLMAPYLLHWEIMREAKKRGLKTYDLGGVAPQSEPYHPLANLNRFKSGFGGEYVEYPGSHDYVLNKFWYQLYLWGRKIL